MAEPLHSQFSNLWGKVTEKGLPQEEKKKRLDKYNMPDNCLFSDPPKVNPEIKAILDPQLHKAIYERDARIVLKQETLNTCLSVVSKILTTIIKEKKDKENLVIIDCANDLLMLLADMNRDESRIRRSLLISKVSASLKPVLGETQCKEFLFGQKLNEHLKSKKACENITKQFKTSGTSSYKSKKLELPALLQTEVPAESLGRDDNSTEVEGSRSQKYAVEEGPPSTRTPVQSTQLTSDNVSTVAGRLRLFLCEWQKITTDKNISSWLKGYHIRFSEKPVQNKKPKQRVWNDTVKPIIS